MKLFDSWAGVLSENQFEKWVTQANAKIVANVKAKHPQTPIIAFAKGAGSLYEDFSNKVKADAFAIDQTVSRKWAKENLQERLGLVIQGNLNNFNLTYGDKDSLKKEILDILDAFNNHPFIFNLDHGIFPQTPIENVELLIDIVRNYR